MPVQQWEYAVMRVDVVSVTPQWTYLARAWVGDQEIYNKNLTERYWTRPLGDLGRQGWELVGTVPENTVVSQAVEGWTGDRSASFPVRMNFFFKRPVI